MALVVIFATGAPAMEQPIDPGLDLEPRDDGEADRLHELALRVVATPSWLHELPPFVRRRAWEKGIGQEYAQPFRPWSRDL